MTMPSPVESKLASIRAACGIAAADLAKRVGVSRQTIHAIEAGSYLPNTQVALLLARELGVSVEDLFSLPIQPSATLPIELLSPAPKGTPVRLCRVHSRWIGTPASSAPYFLPEADGTIGDVGVQLAVTCQQLEKRLLIAGCDPATSLLARMVEQSSGTELIPAAASSTQALQWLADDKVHVAGSHLEDATTGEFNLPYLRSAFPQHRFAVFGFAHWEQGLVTAPKNPKGIRTIADLARKDIRIVNREPGSGSRALLDHFLKTNGIPSKNLTGYKETAKGHLEAASQILNRQADCCLATRSAARAFGLGFIPIHTERYDLVVKRSSLEIPAIQTFLNDLQRAALRRKLEVLADYDTSQTGVLR